MGVTRDFLPASPRVHLPAPRDTSPDCERGSTGTLLKPLELHQCSRTRVPHTRAERTIFQVPFHKNNTTGYCSTCEEVLQGLNWIITSFQGCLFSKVTSVFTLRCNNVLWRHSGHSMILFLGGAGRSSAEVYRAMDICAGTDRVQILNCPTRLSFHVHLCLLSDKAGNIHYLHVLGCLLWEDFPSTYYKCS